MKTWNILTVNNVIQIINLEYNRVCLKKPINVGEYDKIIQITQKYQQIHIEALLVDLSDEAENRFLKHLRRWNENTACFVDETGDGPVAGDDDGTCWSLPVKFIGRYDPEEDDFIGDTFFVHPVKDVSEDEDEEEKLGPGLRFFGRENKRLCGFVFLRTLRTGSRALSLQRGSLLDTVLRLGGSGLNEMWQDSLLRLKNLDPAIGEIAQPFEGSTSTFSYSR